MYATFNRFEIRMTLEQARSVSHSGQCIDDVQELLKVPAISKQFNKIDKNAIREELKEYGCWWDDEELADDVANQERIVWLAGCNISEEHPK